MYLQAGATDGATCELRGHTDTVASAGFSSDGSLLATSGLDGGYCISIYHHVQKEWYRLIVLAVEAALDPVASVYAVVTILSCSVVSIKEVLYMNTVPVMNITTVFQ